MRKVCDITLTISPKRVTQVLTFVVLCLALASVAGQYSKHVLGHDKLFGLVRLFDLDDEGNIPTWFASASLLFCSVLLAIIGRDRRWGGDRYYLHWSTLSGIFLLLSIDEAAHIHESLNTRVRAILKTEGLLQNAWIIPGAAFALIVAVACRHFLADLPGGTRRLFLAAGSLYVGGALGVEALGGWYTALYGQQNMTYALMATIEELLEMLGIVVLIYALLSYMSSHLKEIRVRVGDGAPRSQV